MIDIDEALRRFDEKAYAVRLVRGVSRVVPFAPELASWHSLVDGLSTLDPDARRPVLDHARELTADSGPQRALWLLGALDTADSGISVFSGVSTAVGLYSAERGERLDALETDTQQAVDATVKILALAASIHSLFPGNPLEKVRAFRETETGQILLFYVAAIEVGLPFADNLLQEGSGAVSTLWERFGPPQQERLSAIVSPEEVTGAVATLKQLLEPLDRMAETAKEHVKPLAQAAASYLPTIVDAGDKVAGVAATGADLLPVYRFLGARLVAETALRRAIAEGRTRDDDAQATTAAAVPIQYTRSADDLPDAPTPRRGCLLWPFVLVFGLLDWTALS